MLRRFLHEESVLDPEGSRDRQAQPRTATRKQSGTMIWMLSVVLSLTLHACEVSANSKSTCGLPKPLTPEIETEVQTLPGDRIACYTFYMPDRNTDALIVLAVTSGQAHFYGLVPSKAATTVIATPFDNSFSASAVPRHVIYRNTPESEVGSYQITVYCHDPNLVVYTIAVYFSHPEASIPKPHPKEANLMAALHQECCAEAGNCATWTQLGGPNANQCGLPGWSCNKDGQLTRLILVGDENRDVLSCEFPLEILANYTALERLNLRSNSIFGQINWTRLATSLPMLEYLDLAFNTDLEGTIGCDLASGKLLHLDLASNSFTGPLPTCYMQKEDLIVLRLSDNALSGVLPPTLPLLSKMHRLAVDRNGNITGNLPDVSVLTHARIIDFSDNAITGTLPKNLGVNQPYLKQLSVWQNLMTGEIPNSISQSTNLQSLLLGQNAFSGSIPPGITTLRALSELWLNDNKLSGAMPADWSQMEALQDLDLSSNALTGNLTSSLMSLPSLEELDVSRNFLGGPLPFRDANVTSYLSKFNASTNQLTGPIPESYWSLPFFAPTEITNFAGQEIDTEFDVSYNGLSGDIPNYMLPDMLPAWSFIDVTGNNDLMCPTIFSQYKGITCLGQNRSPRAPDNNTPFHDSPGSSLRGNRSPVVIGISLGILVFILCLLALGGYMHWRNRTNRLQFVKLEGDAEARELSRHGSFATIPRRGSSMSVVDEDKISY